MKQIMQHLERLSSVSSAPVTLLSTEGAVLATYPGRAVGSCERAVDLCPPEALREWRPDPAHPVIVHIGSVYLLGVAALRDRCHVVIGPVSPHGPALGEPAHFAADPILPDHPSGPSLSLRQLRQMLCLVTQLLGDPVPEESILLRYSTVRLPENRAPDTPPNTTKPRISRDFEVMICDAVLNGDRSLLEQRLFMPQDGHVGLMSSDPLRQQRYIFVCLATLVSRAAIRGGLPEELSFDLNDIYCRRMDRISNASEIRDLAVTMLTDYCDRVSRVRRQPAASSVIRNCLSYISLHLHEPITVELLSRQTGLCTRSLSMRFKAELGMGIPEYIHQEKLREADYLLRYTDRSLSEITAYLNYPSQSYFTQVFKKYRGLTPQQYRDSDAR